MDNGKHVRAIRGRIERQLSGTGLRTIAVVVGERCVAARGEQQWLRARGTFRRYLFAPARVHGGPGNADEVGDLRTTFGVEMDGSTFIVKDFWKVSPMPHELIDVPWIGYTYFEYPLERQRPRDPRRQAWGV